jgi:hypothetical protein
MKSVLLVILEFIKKPIFNLPRKIIQLIIDYVFDEYNYKASGQILHLFKIFKGCFLN